MPKLDLGNLGPLANAVVQGWQFGWEIARSLWGPESQGYELPDDYYDEDDE